jgi:hypothetical protein
VRFHTVDYCKHRPNDRALLHRGAWLYGVPRVTLWCRLFGHKPVVDGTEGFADRPGSRWVACDRCGIRPEPQGHLDPAHFDIGQAYTGEYLTRDLTPTVRKQLADRGHTDRLGLPGPWPAHPTTTIGAELHVSRHARFGIGIKVGNAGSEQVLAANFGLPWLFHLYVHTEDHGRFLQRRLNPTGYHSRVIELNAHDGKLWWEGWARRHEWSGTDPWWMHGTLTIDPRALLLGPSRYAYENVGEPVPGLVRMPEGDDHPVTLQLQKQHHGRKRGRKTTSWCVDWRSKAGIPVRQDDWKGDSIYGSGVDVTDGAVANGQWPAMACANIAAQCSRDRAHYNYRPTPAEPATT